MEKITLSTNLVNGILQYLGTQPYTQVAQLIQSIQKEAEEQISAGQVEPSQATEIAELKAKVV